jgi:3-oxoacyl-[acyl-carrier-protein] synthase II
MGAITPVAHDVGGLYRSLCEGRSGVAKIEHFNAQRFPTSFAAEVKNFALDPFVRNAQDYSNAGPNTQFALAAARQALADSELLDNRMVDRSRTGVYLGAGEGIQDFHHMISLIAHHYQPEQRDVNSAGFCQGALQSFHAGRESEQELHTTAAHLAQQFDLSGPNYNCLTACAASSQAIGEATELIRYGDADVMLSGGSHTMIHPFGLTGFNLLTALSTRNDAPARASRPFDLERDGFVLGEGAGMLVLEELEHARRRHAPIYAEVTGYGSTCDAFRVTDSHPDGRGAIACIQGALNDSGLAGTDIGYVNAHGTSTQVNDKVESLALKHVFGAYAYHLPVSSSKSMIGHLIAAAGAVELIISAMTLRLGVLPPTINYDTPDPECDLDYVPNVAREKRVQHVLSNSFGFGGQNISLIVSEFRN